MDLMLNGSTYWLREDNSINSNFETTARLSDNVGQRFVSVQNHVTVDKGKNNQSVSSSRYRGLVKTRLLQGSLHA